MTRPAPSPVRNSRLAAEAVVRTSASRRPANWIANTPTAPEPPWISTRSPGRMSAWANSACQAVSAPMGSAVLLVRGRVPRQFGRRDAGGMDPDQQLAGSGFRRLDLLQDPAGP